MAAPMAVAMILGSALVSLFKGLFARTRPDLAFGERGASSLSFHSGHASMSAVALLSMGALIAATRQRTRERFCILVVASLGGSVAVGGQSLGEALRSQGPKFGQC